ALLAIATRLFLRRTGQPGGIQRRWLRVLPRVPHRADQRRVEPAVGDEAFEPGAGPRVAADRRADTRAAAGQASGDDVGDVLGGDRVRGRVARAGLEGVDRAAVKRPCLGRQGGGRLFLLAPDGRVDRAGFDEADVDA